MKPCRAPLLSMLAGAVLAGIAAFPAAAEGRGHPVLLVSIDGLRPDMVLDADRRGLKIPVLRGLLTSGSYAREVVNVNPTVTNPNHTTLVTGVLPAEHGVYNNRPFEPSQKGASGYSDYAEIKAPTLWGAAKAAGLSTASVFWPVTEHARDIDFNITEGASEDDPKIAGDVTALIEEKRPRLLTVHFVSLDHQSHEHGPDSPEARAALERIDSALGQVMAAERKAFPDAVVAVASDHGFAPLSRQLNLNVALTEAGFITLGAGPDHPVKSWSAFAWYVGGMGMIVLNDPKDASVRAKVGALLRRIAADPQNGVERVYGRSEISKLGMAPNAEFVVALKTGYHMGTPLIGPLVGSHGGGGHGAFSTRTVRRDMHSSFFVTGPGVAAGKDLGVIDMRRIAPTLAGVLKVPLPSAKAPPLALGGR